MQNEKFKISSPSPDLPTIPRLWARDITPEKIGQVMAENHERIALFSDEAGIFDIMGGRYSSGGSQISTSSYKRTRAFRIGWTGGSRPPITMKHPALAIGISPQPSVLRALGENKVFRGRGLLARLLYAMPTSLLGKRTFSGNPVSPAVSARYAAHIQALLSIQPPYGEEREQDSTPSCQTNKPPMNYATFPCMSKACCKRWRAIRTHQGLGRQTTGSSGPHCWSSALCSLCTRPALDRPRSALDHERGRSAGRSARAARLGSL